MNGSCSCGELRYVLRGRPLFVHACHCLKCQKKTGSAFGITTIVLEDDIHVTEGELRRTPFEHRFAHVCAMCGEHIYRTAPNHPATALLQAKSIEDLREVTINAHIFVKRKHDWITLPDDVPQFTEGYVRDEIWPPESLQRLARAVERAAK